jgi:oxygen-dependent protoporphyrinogen oxidase
VDRQHEVAIIGAGISGLSFAHYCARSRIDAVVLESSGAIGGCLRTHRHPHSDFWIELGAHTIYNSYGNLLGILDSIGITKQLIPRRKLPFKLFSGNRLSSIQSQLDYKELLLNLPKALRARKNGRTAEHYFSALAGKINYGSVVGPALDAVICQDASEFPAEAIFKKRLRRKDMPRSFTVTGGLRSIAEAIASSNGVSVASNWKATRIENCGSSFSVIADNGRVCRARKLVLALPPSDAAMLLKYSAPEIASHLSHIESRRIESCGVVVHGSQLSIPRIAGLIGQKQPYFSAVTRDVSDHPENRGFVFHFKPLGLDDRDKLDEICKVLNLDSNNLEARIHAVNQVPALRLGYRDWQCKLDEMLMQTHHAGRLGITGNFFAGLAIEDCVTRSMAEFLRLFPHVI